MKHIFLTGEIQVGKSTLIQTYLAAHPQWKVGGFLTVALHRNMTGRDSVHLVPAAGDRTCTPENCVLQRWGQYPNRQMIAYPQVFDTLGVELLQQTADCDIIIMDEIGTREQDAPAFQQAVLQCLDGDIPVLGVIQPRPGVLTDAIRSHPRVKVLPVGYHEIVKIEF